jgi:anti-sigma regulatory factor (Ser/Thr protein kinase)
VERVDDDGIVALLPPRPASAGVARELVAWQLRDWQVEDLCENAALIITELVANAIRYARTDVKVRVQHLENGIRLEVSDGSTLTLRPRQAGAHEETGRGLLLVEALSSRYGVDADERGKCVWAEVHSA